MSWTVHSHHQKLSSSCIHSQRSTCGDCCVANVRRRYSSACVIDAVLTDEVKAANEAAEEAELSRSQGLSRQNDRRLCSLRWENDGRRMRRELHPLCFELNALHE